MCYQHNAATCRLQQSTHWMDLVMELKSDKGEEEEEEDLGHTTGSWYVDLWKHTHTHFRNADFSNQSINQSICLSCLAVVISSLWRPGDSVCKSANQSAETHQVLQQVVLQCDDITQSDVVSTESLEVVCTLLIVRQFGGRRGALHQTTSRKHRILTSWTQLTVVRVDIDLYSVLAHIY